MAININAKTSGVGGLETTADNSGNINIQSGGSTVMSVTSSGVAVTGSFSQNGAVYSTQPTFRNRIINGDMRIDQRNAGASVTPTASATYVLDRWNNYLTVASKYSVQQNAGAVTPPAGFTNYLGATSLSAYSVTSSDLFVISQSIEGYNVADLAWGTANAKTITLSFWVRSSLTGTFGGSIQNSSQGRSYPYTYTISVANTWEQKSITIPGDTSGTWLTTNGNGLWLFFNLGTGTTGSGTAGAWSGGNYQSATGATSVVGTSGATFYITGVQLEVGTEATPFEHLQYTTQLQLCQRYCWSCDQSISLPVKTDTTYAPMVYLPQHMRAIPSLSNASYTVASGSTGTPAISATGVGGIESSENAVWMYNSANNWTVSVNNYVRLTAIFSAEL